MYVASNMYIYVIYISAKLACGYTILNMVRQNFTFS